MGLGEIIFRTIFDSVNAQKPIRDYQSVSAAAKAAANQINATAGAMGAPGEAITQAAKTVQTQGKLISGNMGKVANDLASTGFRMTFYALTALTAGHALLRGIFIKGMAEAASAFEDAMDRVSDASGITGWRLRSLREDVLDLSISLNEVATQVANALTEAFVMGFSAEDFKSSIAEPLSELAKATSEDFDLLAGHGVRLLKIWGQTADRAPTLAAQLRLVADATRMSLTKQILPTMENIAPLLQGVAQEQIMALVQVAGQFGEEALQRLPKLIQLLYRKAGGRRLRADLGSLLVSVATTSPQLLAEVLGGRGRDFTEYLKRIGTEGYRAIVEQMRGLTDSRRAMDSLMQGATQELLKFSSASRETGKAINNLFIEIGRGALGILTSGLHAVNNIIQTFLMMPRPITLAASAVFTLSSALTAMVAGGLIFVATIAIVGNRIADFVQQARLRGVVIQSWRDLASAFGTISMKGNLGDAIAGMKIIGRLLLVPLRFLAPLVGLMTVFMMLMSDWPENLEKSFPPIAKFLKIIRWMLEDISKSVIRLWVRGELLAQALHAILWPFKGLIEGIMAGFGAGLAAPFMALSAALWAVYKPLELIATLFSRLAQLIEEKLPIISKIFEGIAWVFNSISGFFGSLIGAVIGFGVSLKLLMGVGQTFKAAFGWIGRAVLPKAAPALSWLKAVSGGFLIGLPVIGQIFNKVLRKAQTEAFTSAVSVTVGKMSKGAKLVGGIWVPADSEVSYLKTSFSRHAGAATRERLGELNRQFRGKFNNLFPVIWGKVSGGARVFASSAWNIFKGLVRSVFVGFPKAVQGFWQGFTGRGTMGIVAPGFAMAGADAIAKSGAQAGTFAKAGTQVGAKVGAGPLASLTKAVPFLGKLGKLLGRIPLLVPLSIGLDLLSGVSLPRAILGGLGTWGGAVAGAAIGSLFGPIGTLVGTIIGSIAGYMGGSHIGGMFEGQPAYAQGQEGEVAVPNIINRIMIPEPLKVWVMNAAIPITLATGVISPALWSSLPQQIPYQSQAVPQNVEFHAHLTIQTVGTTQEQAEEIARRTVEIFYQEKENLWMEFDERNKVTQAIQGR